MLTCLKGGTASISMKTGLMLRLHAVRYPEVRQAIILDGNVPNVNGQNAYSTLDGPEFPYHTTRFGVYMQYVR